MSEMSIVESLARIVILALFYWISGTLIMQLYTRIETHNIGKFVLEPLLIGLIFTNLSIQMAWPFLPGISGQFTILVTGTRTITLSHEETFTFFAYLGFLVSVLAAVASSKLLLSMARPKKIVAASLRPSPPS